MAPLGTFKYQTVDGNNFATKNDKLRNKNMRTACCESVLQRCAPLTPQISDSHKNISDIVKTRTLHTKQLMNGNRPRNFAKARRGAERRGVARSGSARHKHKQTQQFSLLFKKINNETETETFRSSINLSLHFVYFYIQNTCN